MAIYLSNAFSLGMLSGDVLLQVYDFETDNEFIKNALKDGFISAVGHQSTADFINALLDIEVPVNRIAINLQAGDEVYVLQLQGCLLYTSPSPRD